MSNNDPQPVLLNAQEAYMQSTTNKYAVARQHLKPIIIKINKAIEQGKYFIDVDPKYLTEVDIEYLRYHGYSYEESNNYYNKVRWDLPKEDK